MIYDIIGDIHGQADKLVGLLNKLGYQYNGDYFVPPNNHRAVFIGDLVDRGKKQLETLNIVFKMLDNNVADAVMGNHEYNALAYATLDKRNNKDYLRKHNETNIKQHQAFIAEVGFHTELHHAWLKRLYELPLWLELEHMCFVHACWDEHAMQVLKPLLTDDNRLTENALQLTSYKGTPEYEALERVLKGVESPLPNGLFMVDKEGTKRHNVRIKWWKNKVSYQPVHEVARISKSDLAHIPVETLTGEIDFQLLTNKPIFIGHYWLTGDPELFSEQVVCVDYSAGGTGFLTAYQFDSDNPTLSVDNFIQFQHNH